MKRPRDRHPLSRYSQRLGRSASALAARWRVPPFAALDQAGFGVRQRSCVSTQGKPAQAARENVAMSMTMDDSIKRWTAKRKTALVIEIIQGKTTVSEASR